MSQLEPFENQSKVTQVELICVLDKYDPYVDFVIACRHAHSFCTVLKNPTVS